MTDKSYSKLGVQSILEILTEIRQASEVLVELLKVILSDRALETQRHNLEQLLKKYPDITGEPKNDRKVHEPGRY